MERTRAGWGGIAGKTCGGGKVLESCSIQLGKQLVSQRVQLRYCPLQEAFLDYQVQR